MLAETWTDPSVVLGGGAFLGAVGVALTLVFRMSSSVPKAYEDQVDQMGKRMAILEKSHRRCDRRVALLIEAMHRAGVDIPPEVFDS